MSKAYLFKCRTCPEVHENHIDKTPKGWFMIFVFDDFNERIEKFYACPQCLSCTKENKTLRSYLAKIFF